MKKNYGTRNFDDTNQSSQTKIVIHAGGIFSQPVTNEHTHADYYNKRGDAKMYANGLKYLGRHNKRTWIENRSYTVPKSKKIKNVQRAIKHFERSEETPAWIDEEPCEEELLSPRFVKQIQVGIEQKIGGFTFSSEYIPFFPSLGPAQFVGAEEPMASNCFFTPEGEFAGILMCSETKSLQDGYRDDNVCTNVPMKDFRTSRLYKKVQLPYKLGWSREQCCRIRRKATANAMKGIKDKLNRLFQYEYCLALLHPDGPHTRAECGDEKLFLVDIPHEWK